MAFIREIVTGGFSGFVIVQSVATEIVFFSRSLSFVKPYAHFLIVYGVG
jgi:hypothetical protein